MAIAVGLTAASPPPFKAEPDVLAGYSQTIVAPAGFIESVEAYGPHVWIVVRNESSDNALWRIDVGTAEALKKIGWDKILVPGARVRVVGRLADNEPRTAAAVRMGADPPETNVLSGHEGALTEELVAQYVAAPWSPGFWMNRRLVLGDYGGNPLVADFPCNDICPVYTTRIIHYDVKPGGDCDAIGALSQQLITRGGSVGYFCVPKFLVDRGLQVPDQQHRLR